MPAYIETPIRHCEQCSGAIQRGTYSPFCYRKLRFCGRACARKAYHEANRKLRPPGKCRVCDKDVKGQAAYCSNECRKEAARVRNDGRRKREIPERHCESCPKPIPRMAANGHTLSPVEYLRKRFCSASCSNKNRSRIARERRAQCDSIPIAGVEDSGCELPSEELIARLKLELRAKEMKRMGGVMDVRGVFV